MISLEDARAQGDVLAAAAKDSPIPTIAAMLKARGAEWAKAAKWHVDATDDGHTPVIWPAAVLEPGCDIWWGGTIGTVLRVANGGMGIQIVEQGFGARWENTLGPTSPVVVLV